MPIIGLLASLVMSANEWDEMFLWVASVIVGFGVLAVVTMFVTWVATSTARALTPKAPNAAATIRR